MLKLTKRYIEALPACDKENFVWDGILKGFGIYDAPMAASAMSPKPSARER